MARVIPFDEIRLSHRAALYEGGADGVDASTFITQYERGEGPDLHLHPYPEVFVVHAGTAEFTAGDERLTVAAGNVVVVPPETPHGFKGAGDDTLRVVSIHPSPKVEQTNL
jgi:quercetin dioxygenase-like cupin family protein